MKSLRVSGLAGGLALALSALAGSAQAQQAAVAHVGGEDLDREMPFLAV